MCRIDLRLLTAEDREAMNCSGRREGEEEINGCGLQVYTKIRNTVSSVFVNMFCAY